MQRGCPTYVGDVAEQVLYVLSRLDAGVYNLTAQGQASRFEYVSEIVRAASLPCVVSPGPAFQRLARVSSNETSVNRRLGELGLDRMPNWRTSLEAYVQSLTRINDPSPCR